MNPYNGYEQNEPESDQDVYVVYLRHKHPYDLPKNSELPHVVTPGFKGQIECS
jgi:hypothetical protein